MRLVVASRFAAGISVLAALALAFARLGNSLDQLRALDFDTERYATIRAAQSSARQQSAANGTVPDELTIDNAAEDMAQRETGVPAEPHDEHVEQWLAANPELQRAAAELLEDPDAEVRREASQFLVELGVLKPHANR